MPSGGGVLDTRCGSAWTSGGPRRCRWCGRRRRPTGRRCRAGDRGHGHRSGPAAVLPQRGATPVPHRGRGRGGRVEPAADAGSRPAVETTPSRSCRRLVPSVTANGRAAYADAIVRPRRRRAFPEPRSEPRGHPEPARRRGREPADPRVEGHPEGGPRPTRVPTSSTGSSPQTDRSPQVLRSLQSLFDHGRLARHRATCRSCRSTRASSTRPRRRSRRTRSTSIRRTSSSWPSRAAATRWPPPSACSARCRGSYAHRIPFIVKLNHNELLTLPEQVRPGHVRLGRAGLRPRRRRRRAPPSTSAPRSRPASSRR